MRTWPLRAALLCLLAVVAASGCQASGGLDDAGATRSIQAHPSPQPLWAAAESSVPAEPQAVADQQAPVPLPGLSVGALTEVDARTVLAKDPGLGAGERAAVDGGCTGCLVQPAQYRDLNGDGRPELLTAVVTGAGSGAGRAVLHVYALHGREVLPVLSLAALPGFTAETVGADLVVHEPTGPLAETSSTYRWNAVRMAFVDRRIKATGPAANAPGCLPDASPAPSAVPSPRAEPTVAPTPPAPGRTAAPAGGAPSAVPDARRPSPTRY
ncbi:hypothetical protein [Streptomyces sp. TLI_171]|uniref:hypothetical protein n=1 Tax=Streptomyces sp. TLI_171 TaxID=1938859 RepID=UPI000C18EFDD|nr:hypothetical protein [Streptomyces sp. TLI_171]RKE18916.1 hypothetical protein BX266_2212 [Streptomyces sp. TLI_171]